jgi:hypothetical protein
LFFALLLLAPNFRSRSCVYNKEKKARLGKPGQDRQNRTVKLDRQNRTIRTGQAEQGMQIRQAEQNEQNRTGKTE